MQAREPNLLWRGDSSRREIAVTFDDGPHPRDTPGVLAVLAKHNLRATFFLIGEEVEKYSTLVRQIHESGHQIGIHCYRHTPFPFEDTQKLRAQLERTKNLIAAACGISANEIKDLRPPYGWFTRRLVPLLTSWGYRLVMWNCIPPHYLQPLNWTIKQVLDSSIPGSIIVLHDGHGHGSKAAQIVDTVVPQLKAQRFEFVTIGKMQHRNNK